MKTSSEHDMLKSPILQARESPLRNKLASLILVVNSFTWYFYAFSILIQIMRKVELTYFQMSIIWIVNLAGTTVFALMGAFITSRIGRKIPFLLLWMGIGIVCSFISILPNISAEANIYAIAFSFGAASGLGMPAAMAYFSDCTVVENRARFGGIIFLAIGLGMLSLEMIRVTEIVTNLLILTIWRVIGLAVFLLVRPTEKLFDTGESVSYATILGQKSFLLFFIPWIMFCLINQTSAPIIANFFGEGFINFSAAIEGTLTGAFAIIGGSFCDKIGRKRVAMSGFVMLGIGYAVLGILPDIVGWYIYSATDGLAWGIFYTIFFMTIWGDLAHDKPSEKYYAIGELPYLFSNFLRLMLGSYIAGTVVMYAIFSLASFFLFLAVLPLMYAPETLPEKKIKERELKTYIEKAKKAKEKYA